MKRKIAFVIALYICISFCFSSVFYCADLDKNINGKSETKTEVMNRKSNIENNETEEIEEEPFDEYVINKDIYISDNTIDDFEMKTKRLKIKTEGNIVIDSDETSYIITFCILNKVEYLDFSGAKFLDNKFSAGTFMASKYMKEIVLPDSIEEIGEYSFYDWTKLEKINFPKELNKIGRASFSGCIALKEIELNENLQRIEEQAFLGCNDLQVVKLPDKVNFVGRFSFADCKNLVELHLPCNDNIELDGNILSNKKTIFVVYDGSDAFKKMLMLDEHGPIYKTTNKIALKAKVSVENLNKKPNLKIIKNKINRGDEVSINDLVSVDIKGTGAMSYSLKLEGKKELKEYEKGNHELEYKIRYYLSDIDVSNIYGKISKVEDTQEILESADKYFVYAKIYEESKVLELEVLDYSSGLSKSVNKFTVQNSYILSKKMHEPFMNGFKDNTFRPFGNLTNEETAVILAKLSKYNSENKYLSSYIDVDKKSWSINYIGYVTREDIMTGVNNKFRPHDFITRLEFTVAVCKMLKIKASENKSNFVDVWGKKEEGYVAALEERKAISGFKNGSFGPNKTITRAEAVKILVSLLNREPNKGKICKEVESNMIFTDVKKSDWFYIYVLEATTKHNIYAMH